MKKIIILTAIILLAFGCKTSNKLSMDSKLIDKSTSSTQESKQEETTYFNSLIIDTTSNSEVEITITEIVRTEQRDSSGVVIKETVKETKTNAKKQNNGLTMAKNDSVDKVNNTINSDVKNDVKKNDKTKESKEVKANYGWIYKVVIVLAFLVVIWLNRKKIIKKLFQFKSR